MDIPIDIETIPTQREDLKQLIEVKAPGNYKKQESIDKWIEENHDTEFDKQWRKTALDGTQGEIICIAWQCEGLMYSVQRSLEGSEEHMLNGFFDALHDSLSAGMSLRAPRFIGHNICDFDLRFIWHRCVVNNVKPKFKIPYDAKPWSDQVYDTLYEWKGNNKAGGSLKKACQILGILEKGDIDGSKVWDYVKDGKIDEVVEYCKDDVIRTFELYKRMNFL